MNMANGLPKTYLQEHAEMAAETFDGFEILSYVSAGDMECWTVGKPGGFVNRHFTIVTWPGNILTTGDNGECWWQRERGMIGWCRGAIRSMSYFAEKVVPGFTVREFDAEQAEEWIKEQQPDDDTRGTADIAFDETRSELLAALQDGEAAFVSAFAESDWHESGDWPGRSWERYTQQFLWARAAVAKFIELLDAKGAGRDA
jgi:hypothetical protein